jgi:hypothetical protein
VALDREAMVWAPFPSGLVMRLSLNISSIP